MKLRHWVWVAAMVTPPAVGRAQTAAQVKDCVKQYLTAMNKVNAAYAEIPETPVSRAAFSHLYSAIADAENLVEEHPDSAYATFCSADGLAKLQAPLDRLHAEGLAQDSSEKVAARVRAARSALSDATGELARRPLPATR